MSKRFPSGSSDNRKAFKGTKFTKPNKIKLSKNKVLKNDQLQNKYNDDRFKKIGDNSDLVVKRRPDLEYAQSIQEMPVETALLEPIHEKRIQSEFDTQGK